MNIYKETWTQEEINDYINSRTKEHKDFLDILYLKDSLQETDPGKRAFFIVTNILDLGEEDRETLNQRSEEIGKVKVLNILEELVYDKNVLGIRFD